VIILTRDARQATAMFGPAIWLVESLGAIPSETRIGAIVNLAGPPILGAVDGAVAAHADGQPRRADATACRIG